MSETMRLKEAALYSLATMQMSTVGLCTMDRHSVIKVCNRAFANLFDHDWDELIGMPMKALVASGQSNPHATFQGGQTDMFQHINRGDVIKYAKEGVVRGIRKDGSEVHLYIWDRQASVAEGGEFIQTGKARLATKEEIIEYEAGLTGSSRAVENPSGSLLRKTI